MKSHFTVILRPITLHLRVSLRGAGVRIIFAMYRRNPGREAVRSMAMVDRSPPGGVTSQAEHGQHKTGDNHSDNTGTPGSHNQQSPVNVRFHVMFLCIV